MPDTDPGIISFYPWTRRGAVTLPQDTLAAGMGGAASIPVSLQVRNNPAVVQTFRLLSPSDVIGFDSRQVIRTEPPAGSRNYEPNFLAAVEFNNPDLPWLLTPASPDAQGRLRPFVCLVVVRQQPGVSITGSSAGASAILDIRQPAVLSAELPNLAQSWAWAHSQVTGQLAGQTVDQIDAGAPERTLSRLLCPRRLDANADYYACVVPAFEAGRKAGLGLTLTKDDDASLLPAWTSSLTAVQLPIYYQWQFSTGPVGDFASLVKLLKTYSFPATSGVRPMYVGASASGMPSAPVTEADATVGLESALMPPGSHSQDWTGTLADAFRAALRKLMATPANAADDPLVGPPFYAGRHANRLAVPADPATPPTAGELPEWLRELNLDPRNRAVAAFGTRVVQDQQEALMASAWDQAGELKLANRILRHAHLVRRASLAIYGRHLAKLASDTLFSISRPIHTRVALAANTSVRKTFTDSNLPTAVVSRAFRTIARPRGPIMRAVLPPAQRITRPILSGIALRKLPFTAPAQQFGVVSPDMVEQKYHAAGGTTAVRAVSFFAMQGLQNAQIPQRPFFQVRQPAFPGVNDIIPIAVTRDPKDSGQAAAFRAAQAAHQAMVGPNVMVFILNLPPLDLDTLKPALLARMEPAAAIAGWVKPLLTRAAATAVPAAGAPVTNTSATNDDLDEVAWAPQFPQPMYEALRDLSPDLLAPAIQDVPDNRVALLQTNPKFIEAYMAGLNQEMARELLWRGFPTDQRGTSFQVFWDRSGAAQAVDIPPIPQWTDKAHLGDNATQAGNALVLLIKGEITRRYPDALVSMVAASWPQGATRPALGTYEVQPAFRGSIDPDIKFYGFPLNLAQAYGLKNASSPGFFFVIQEHPCAPRFGVEPDAPPAAPAPGTDAAVTARSFLQTPVRMAIFLSDLLPRS